MSRHTPSSVVAILTLLSALPVIGEGNQATIFRKAVDPKLQREVAEAVAKLQRDIPVPEETRREIDGLMPKLALPARKIRPTRAKLRRFGRQAVPRLVLHVTSPETEMRRNALGLLGRTVTDVERNWKFGISGEADRPPLPEWASVLVPVFRRASDDVDRGIRGLAATNLLICDPKEGPGAVAELLNDPDPVRQEAVGRMLMEAGHEELVPEKIRKAVRESGISM